jgi:hypothetical protein
VLKLYKTNGATVTQVSNTRGNQSVTDYPHDFMVFNNELYFVANNSNGVLKLYKTNGATVTQVSNTSNNQSATDSPYSFTVFNNELYFIALGTEGHAKYFKANGLEVYQVSDINPGGDDLDALTGACDGAGILVGEFLGKLYLTATVDASGCVEKLFSITPVAE